MFRDPQLITAAEPLIAGASVQRVPQLDPHAPGYAAFGNENLIRFRGGDVALSQIKAGNYVSTRDSGDMRVLWISDPLKTASLYQMRGTDFFGTQNCNVLIKDPTLVAITGTDEALTGLSSLKGELEPVTGLVRIVVFERCELINLGGVWVQSFDPNTLPQKLDLEWQRSLCSTYPRLCHQTGRAAYVRPRPILDSQEYRRLKKRIGTV